MTPSCACRIGRGGPAGLVPGRQHPALHARRHSTRWDTSRCGRWRRTAATSACSASEEGTSAQAAGTHPDGIQIAFQADLDGGCIYRSDPRARGLTRLTTGCSQGGSLSWSPDGTRIVTAGGGHGPRDAVVMNADGGDKQAITTNQEAAYVDWQPSNTP